MGTIRILRSWSTLGFALVCMSVVNVSLFSIGSLSADELQEESQTEQQTEKSVSELSPNGIVDEKRFAELMKKYREVREELARIDADEYPLSEQPDRLLVAFDSPAFVTAYLGGDQKQVRVFATRLILINPTAEQISLSGRAITLEEDGQTREYKALNPQLTNYSVNVSDGYPSLKSLEVAQTVNIPSQGIAATWLVFQGFNEGNHVPAMTVNIPVGDEIQSIDLNQYFQALLKVRTQRIGPKDCLALMTIHGHATTVGLSALVDQVDEMSAKGLSRLIVEWAPEAVEIDQSIRNSFIQAVASHGRQEYGDEERFLGLPDAITELAVIIPNDQSFESVSYSNEGTARFFRWASDAATQVLASAYDLTSDDDLLDELRDGHPYSKMAALKLAGGRLGIQQLPLLLDYAKNEDSRFRYAAYVALSFIDHVLAQEALLNVATAKGEDAASEEAIRCLLMSPHNRLQNQVLTLLKNDDIEIRQRAMKTISMYPQSRWRDQIEELLASPTPDVQIQALKALSQIGHPDLKQILLSYLKSDDTKIRREAFVQLAAINDPRLTKILTNYCLVNIKSSPTDSQLLDYLSTHKPHAAIAPLKALFLQTSENRAPLIGALISIGDYETFETLISNYGNLKSNEERNALLSIGVVSTSHYQRLVKMMLEQYSPDSEVTLNQMLSDVYYYADNATLESLITFVGRWERDPRAEEGQLSALLAQAINAISQLSNSRSRQYLAELVVKTENKPLREQTLTAINNSYQNNPGYNISHETEQFLRDKNFTKALKIANLAIDHDEESPHAFAVRGDCYYHQAEIEKAIADYTRALTLNPAMSDVFIKRSDCYLIQNNVAAAEADLKLADRLRENRVDITEALGQLYRRTGQLDQALTMLKKAAELGPQTSRGITAKATVLMYEAGPIDAIRFLEESQEKDSPSISFQYTSAALYAIASKSIASDGDESNDKLIDDYRKASLQLLKKIEASGSCKVKLISGDPAFGGLDQVEGFKALFEKHGKSKVTADAVGAISPVKSSSYSASIEAGKNSVLPAVHEVAAPVKDPQLVSGEVLLLAPPK